MKNRNGLVAFIILLATLLLPATPLSALEIPLLTWEKGKVQSVVLGGGTAVNKWKVFLKSSQAAMLELNPSRSNKDGFVIYSLTLPRDIANGAYSIVTRGANSPETLVAAVQIIDMISYSITQISTDLLFFLLSIAFWLTSLAALRGAHFRRIVFFTSTGPKERYLAGEPAGDFIEHVYKFVPLEKLRIRIYEQIPDSFFKFLLKSDSRGLHLTFPRLWAFLPMIGIGVAAALGVMADSPTQLSFTGFTRILFIGLAFLGSLDIYAGIISAVAFFSVTLWLLPDFSVSSVTAIITNSLCLFLPALASTYFATLASQQNSHGIRRSINSLFFTWATPMLMVHTLFLVSRSLTSSVAPSFGLEVTVIAAVWSGQQIQSYLSRQGIPVLKRPRVVEEFEVTIGRLISPIFAIIVLLYFGILLFVWTDDISNSLWLAAMLTAPFFLLLARPTWSRLLVLQRIRRNYLIEIGLVVIATFVAFIALQEFPIIDSSSAHLFIAVGLLPVLLYALFAFAADLSHSVEKDEVSA